MGDKDAFRGELRERERGREREDRKKIEENEETSTGLR